MKVIKLLFFLVVLLAVTIGAYWLGTQSPASASGDTSSAPASASSEKTLYTCGMHPNVIQDKPGLCPICEMKLTPLRRGGAAASSEPRIKFYKSTMIPGEIRQEPGKDSMGMDMVPVYEDEAEMAGMNVITIDPVTIQNMAIRTTVVSNGPLRRTIRTVATVEYDETGLADVTLKFKGWAEKLYVDTTGAQVHRGDPLFEVYSPELYSAQTEYLLAVASATQSGSGQGTLMETARTKLKYWDISDAQIAELERTRKPQKTLKVFAPIDGFVTEKMVVEGQMVDMGMKLYRIVDLGLVWLHAQVYEQDLPFIQLGQEAVVSLSYLPDRKFRGRVTYIYPDLDPRTRTAKVRMEFHNPGYFLKPGMFASVELAAELSPSALLVPDMAVLRSGARNTVFVALDGGKFEPRTVSLGARAENDQVQVLAGLKAGERVVSSGQFMLDSESQLREAIQKMLNPPTPGTTPERHAEPTLATGTGAAPPETGSSGKPPRATYLCPMPEHVAIEYDHPGNCPLCGMALVPVSSEALSKIQPGGTVEYYTCPMPEHADVRLDKPGKCPRCRMTLIPVMPKPSESHSTDAHAGGDHASVAPDPAPLPPLYTCPMAGCQTVSDQEGRCPKCNMKLVDTATVDHGKDMEALWRQQHPAAAAHDHTSATQLKLYTCPMASHAHVVSDQPGRCPECGMKLVETSTVDHQMEAEKHWRERHAAQPRN